MKVFDRQAKADKEFSTEELIALMATGNRQVDLYHAGKQTDGDGYLSWDHENWTSVDGKRFIRSYSLEGKTLFEYSSYNKYDMKTDFRPDQAMKVELN